MNRWFVCFLTGTIFTAFISPVSAQSPIDAPLPVERLATPKPTLPEAKSEKRFSVQEVIAKASDSVVVITFTGRSGVQEGLGTGFVISADGYIATNLHVIGEARPIKVRLASGKQYDVEQIYASDRHMDLAILKVAAKDLKPLPLGNSNRIQQGDSVVVIGNPQGLQHSVVTGIVSSKREVEGRPMIQLAIPIERGNSGGPVIDMFGNVQGVVTLKSAVTDNLGFAVEIDVLKTLLEKPNPIPISRWLTIGTLDSEEWTVLHKGRWKQRAGKINVQGVGGGFGGRSLAISKQVVPELPYELGVWVRLDDENGAAGLAFHSDGANRHYGFYPSNGRLRLTRFDGPDVFSWHVIREKRVNAYRPGEWNRLKVRLSAGRIVCFCNGQQVFDEADGRYSTGQAGLAKFRNTVAEFKNFQIAKELPSAELAPDIVAQLELLMKDLPVAEVPGVEAVDQVLTSLPIAGDLLRDRARELEKRADQLRTLANAAHEKKVCLQLASQLDEPGEKTNLFHAALLIASLDNHELDVASYLKEFRRMVKAIQATVMANSSDEQKLNAIDRYLYEEQGFHGSRNDYYNRSNSYLNEVIDDREGLPVALSVLYMEFARELGVKVVGVGLPGHFIVRHEPESGEQQSIDPFERGKRLNEKEVAKIVSDHAGREPTAADLQPQTPKAIVQRMLSNLFGVAQRNQDRNAMLRYVEAMISIDPQIGSMRWYRALLRYQTQRFKASLSDLEWLLENQPAGVDLDNARQLKRVIEQAQ